MDSKRAEILSAMQSVAEDIRPTAPAGTSPPPGVQIDIGGINLRQVVSADKSRGSRNEETAPPPGPTPDQRRKDCQLRSILRLLGIFLAFGAILPLYLVEWLPDEVDHIALWIGFVSLLGSMASFAATVVYENA
jgi:hypothetical protein